MYNVFKLSFSSAISSSVLPPCVSSMACVSKRAMVSNSMILAARSRVNARKTVRLISATSGCSTAATNVSWVLAA